MSQIYPLFFRFSVPVQGRGFVALVRVLGRAIAHEEPEGWWIDGVEPGSVAEGGQNLHAAYDEFRATFCGVLFDLANEVGSFAEFEQQARGFFEQVDAEDEGRWKAARAAVRAGITQGLDRLRREERDQTPELAVVRVDADAANHDIGPDKNRVDEWKTAA